MSDTRFCEYCGNVSQATDGRECPEDGGPCHWVLDAEQVALTLARIRSAYPTEVFVPESDSVDARAAAMARHVIDVIVSELFDDRPFSGRG